MNHRTLVASLLLVLAAVPLAGCSTVSDVLHHEASYEFDSTAALAAGWNGSAPWVPSDSSDIRIRESAAGSPSMIRLASAAVLSSSCVQQKRLSAPAFDVSWAPNAYVENVWVCGDWDVIPTNDGYFGWTPIAPGESPAPTSGP